MPGNVPDLVGGFLVLGLCAGLISGALGLGSGTVLIPALVLLFHFPQKSAQGTALSVMVPMVLVGAMRYRLDPSIEVRWWPVCAIALGAVAGALAGAAVASRVPAHVLRKAFAVFLVVVAARMLIARPRQDTAAPRAGHPQNAQCIPSAIGDSGHVRTR